MELDLGRSESNADQRLNPLWQQLQSILVAIATTLEPEVNSFELRTDESREAGTAEQLIAMLEQMKEPLRNYDPPALSGTDGSDPIQNVARGVPHQSGRVGSSNWKLPADRSGRHLGKDVIMNQQESVSCEAHQPPPAKRDTILIVDDLPANTDVLVAALADT